MESIYKWREKLEIHSKIAIFLSLFLLFILIFFIVNLAYYIIIYYYEIYLELPFQLLLIITTILFVSISVPMFAWAYYKPDSVVSLVIPSIEPDPKNPLHRKAINSFEKMKIAFGYKNVKLKIVDWNVINAFVVSKKDESIIYVTKGALEKLDEHELDAVMAHEFSHIVNKDAYYLTLGVIVAGIIIILSYVILRFPILVSRKSKTNIKARGVASRGATFYSLLILFAILLAIISPIIQKYLLSKFSKTREYLADTSAVAVTKYPPAMINALAKVARENTHNELKNKAIPLSFAILLFDYESFETHPPVWERILRISQTTRTPIDPRFLEGIKSIEQQNRTTQTSDKISDLKYFFFRKMLEQQKSEKDQKIK